MELTRKDSLKVMRIVNREQKRGKYLEGKHGKEGLCVFCAEGYEWTSQGGTGKEC